MNIEGKLAESKQFKLRVKTFNAKTTAELDKQAGEWIDQNIDNENTKMVSIQLSSAGTGDGYSNRDYDYCIMLVYIESLPALNQN